MDLNIQEINGRLEKISEGYSKLFAQEQKLKKEKQRLLAKDILDSKPFSRYKWEVKKRDRAGFILKPYFDDDMRFDDLQEKLDLYPHGGFQLLDKIELSGDDGDLYIVASDIKAGIEFIKSQNIEIVIDKSIIDDIKSMEKQIAGLKDFVNQFDTSAERRHIS
jgi:hypothetical protein